MTDYTSEIHRRAASYFDRRGELFDSLYSEDGLSSIRRYLNKRFRRDINERYLMTLDSVKENDASDVLDVGIGGARYAEGYIECGVKRVVGVDISETMLDFAREHIAGLGDTGTEFELIKSDINDFKISETFDVVVAMGFFDYIEDTLTSLKKLRSLAEKAVAASFPSISVWRTPIRKVRYIYKRCPVFFFRRRQIEELSKAAGFTSCRIIKIKGSGMDFFVEFKV